MRSATTFVWHGGDNVVVAYYSLAAHLVIRAEIPPPTWAWKPKSDPGDSHRAVELSTKSMHGQGHGGALLADCLLRAVSASENVAARFVVVDAIDGDASRFYGHYGFRAVPDSNRLIQKMGDIAASLGR